MFGRKVILEVMFNDTTKGVQDNHIDKQMYPSCMKKPVSEKTIPVVTVFYIICIEFKLVEKVDIVKS